LLTGSIGLTMGVVFLATGRNLWVPIIAHTLYDTARIVGFYLHGPPPW
jgi:membrane protease YdiL (CAAX protease family)